MVNVLVCVKILHSRLLIKWFLTLFSYEMGETKLIYLIVYMVVE